MGGACRAGFALFVFPVVAKAAMTHTHAVRGTSMRLPRLSTSDWFLKAVVLCYEHPAVALDRMEKFSAHRGHAVLLKKLGMQPGYFALAPSPRGSCRGNPPRCSEKQEAPRRCCHCSRWKRCRPRRRRRDWIAGRPGVAQASEEGFRSSQNWQAGCSCRTGRRVETYQRFRLSTRRMGFAALCPPYDSAVV